MEKKINNEKFILDHIRFRIRFSTNWIWSKTNVYFYLLYFYKIFILKESYCNNRNQS